MQHISEKYKTNPVEHKWTLTIKLPKCVFIGRGGDSLQGTIRGDS